MRWGGSPKLTLIDYDFDYASPSGITSDSYAWYTFEYNSEDQLTRFGTQFGTLLGTADIVQNNVGRLDEKSYTYEENGVPVFYNKVTYEYTSSNAHIESVTVVRGTSASTQAQLPNISLRTTQTATSRIFTTATVSFCVFIATTIWVSSFARTII